MPCTDYLERLASRSRTQPLIATTLMSASLKRAPSRRGVHVALVLGVLALWGAPAAQAQSDIAEFEQVYQNIEFDFPLGIRFPDDGTNRVYVAEYRGVIKVLDNVADVQEASVFLDISERLSTSPPGDFFAIEFHPDYAENGYFYVRYKLQNPHRTVLSRFSRSQDNPLEADIESEVVLLEIETPGNTQDHHGGDIAFGPDGYLYVPLGDGGTLYDEAGNAQDLSVLLGKVLRLDVDNPSGGLEYGIPPDNPFVGNDQGWREEIFAYGLRNPWRLTVDRATGDVWVGNVGESTWEEVEYIEAGKNYGWPIMEGPICAPFGPPDCDQEGLTPPVWAYSHDAGVSITGGYVYRGEAIPALRGKYVFADFASYRVWFIERDNPTSAELLLPEQFNVTTFGEDLDGELYFTRFFGGKIYKITPGPGATDTTDSGPSANGVSLSVYPNPARGAATVRFTSESSQVRLEAYDLLGRRVATLFDEQVGPGANRALPFDTQRLAPGMYILKLEARGEVVTKRVVVVR